MLFARVRQPWKTALLLLVLLSLVLLLPRKFITQHYQAEIHEAHEAPTGLIAIVFGAGLRYDGQPSAVLADRVSTAVDLYRQGKVKTLLMSGSTRAPDYDEPQAMRALALTLGVPEEDIVLDPGGTRTFISCLRAQKEFQVKDALLVSQSFHLPRAMAICDGLGITAVGVQADLRTYNSASQHYWALRELPATLLALWDTMLVRISRLMSTEYHP